VETDRENGLLPMCVLSKRDRIGTTGTRQTTPTISRCPRKIPMKYYTGQFWMMMQKAPTYALS